MPEEKQEEFFSEFTKNKKGFKLIKKKDILGPRVNIVMSPEKLVFFIIGTILLLVLSFSLGVERGKRLNPKTAITPSLALNAESKIPQTVQQPAIDLAPVTAQKEPTTLFTIQVVTYKQGDLAKKEIERLKRQKFDAFVIERGQFHQVCVGNFQQKQEAENLLKTLKKNYKDCFIRKR